MENMLEGIPTTFDKSSLFHYLNDVNSKQVLSQANPKHILVISELPLLRKGLMQIIEGSVPAEVGCVDSYESAA